MNEHIENLSEVISSLTDMEKRIVLAYIQGLIFSKRCV